MSEIYRQFSKTWEHVLDFSDNALIEMFNYESSGSQITNPGKNGFYVGKQWMDVNIKMWREDIAQGFLLRKELYEDPAYPRWWLDKVLP